MYLCGVNGWSCSLRGSVLTVAVLWFCRNQADVDTDIKTKIIKTAGEMFFKYGVKSVSIDDICNELHISKKTFYANFRQKNDLVAEFLERFRQKDLQVHASVAECGNVVEFLVAEFKRFAAPMVMEKHAAMYFDLEKYYPELFHDHRTKHDADICGFMVDILKLGMEQGLFRNDLDVDMTAFFMTQGFSHMLAVSNDKWTNARKITFLLDMFLRSVCTSEGLDVYLAGR